MSFTNQSGALSTFEEVVPDVAKLGGGLSSSSLLTQRRRVRVVPQGGQTFGSAGSGAAGAQMQFLVADQGGLVDMRSVSINYAVQVVSASSDATVCVDDGHVFSTVQIGINGQLLDNIQSAMKLSNIEMKLGGSRTYYQSAGSLQGWELLNPDLTATLALAGSSSLVAQCPQWGYVTNNVTDLSTRQRRAGVAAWNSVAGEFRSIPLALISGVGRIKQYLPVAILGELQFILVCGSNAEVCFQTGATADGTYSLSNVSLTYDVVVPDQRYADLLRRVSTEDGSGLTIPFESTIMTSAGAISGSSTALSETTIIVSRATNHLIRSSLVQVPQAVVATQTFPSQSCFSHAGTWSVQWRIGSQYYPQIPAEGDSDMFNTALAAYGSVEQTNGSVINRALWGQSTSGATPGTATSYETAQTGTAGTTSVKFAYADSFIPSYGFATVKGAAEPLDVDGVSVAGASGSQIQIALRSAPYTTYTPFVSIVSLKFILARGAAVSVDGM
jgi:hypothetical protein